MHIYTYCISIYICTPHYIDSHMNSIGENGLCPAATDVYTSPLSLYIYVCIYACIYIYMYILCVCIYIHIYIHTHIYVHVYKYMNFSFTHACALCGWFFFCKNLHTYIYQIKNMYTLFFLPRASCHGVLYSCIFTNVYTHIYTKTIMHKQTHVHI